MSVRAWVIRVLALLIFNVGAMLVILVLPGSQGLGFGNVLWGAIVLTLLSLFIKPALTKWFSDAAGNLSLGARLGAKAVSYLVLYLVALAIWVLIVLFSPIGFGGGLSAIIVPPLLLLLAWFVYDLVDDALEAWVARLLGGPRR